MNCMKLAEAEREEERRTDADEARPPETLEAKFWPTGSNTDG